MNPKISIVVPIYNMDRYLSRCMDSLIGQSMKELEIIAVNDGSTDQSMRILREYAEKDSRIKILNRTNGGVSSARNAGIRASRGDYIGFADPDDWADPDMYRLLYEAAEEEQADIAMCGYIREFGTHAKVKDFDYPDKTVYRKDTIKTELMRKLIGPLEQEIANPEMLDAWGTVWTKLYRTRMIREHEILFTDLRIIGTNEDSLFNIYACYAADGFVFLNRPLYHYWRVNPESLTSGYKPELKEQWLRLYRLLGNFIEDEKLDICYREALNNRICMNMMGLGLNTISKGNKATMGAKIKTLSAILNDHEIRRSFRQFNLAQCSVIWRTFFYFAKIRFAAGLYFMLIAIEQLRRMHR